MLIMLKTITLLNLILNLSYYLWLLLENPKFDVLIKLFDTLLGIVPGSLHAAFNRKADEIICKTVPITRIA